MSQILPQTTKIFIGSSSASERFVSALKETLERKMGPSVECVPWYNALDEGEYILEALIGQADNCQYAVFVFNTDDVIYINGGKSNEKMEYATRDNVVFELGLFIGKLGRKRVLFCMPSDAKDLHLPSDLGGILQARYDSSRKDERDGMEKAANALVRQIRRELPSPTRVDLASALGQLDKKVSNLVELVETRSVGVFPDYLRDQVCSLLKKEGDAWIATEAVPYGAFSAPEWFKKYMDVLTGKKEAIHIVIPEDDCIRAATARQMPEEEWKPRFSEEEGPFRDKITQFEHLIRHYCPNDFSARISSPNDFYESVLKLNKGVWKYLEDQRDIDKRVTKIVAVGKDLPMYLWIVGKKEAVFSVPMDRSGTSKNSDEHGFFTRVPDLVKGLHASWERYLNPT